jgi:hypothetical protein
MGRRRQVQNGEATVRQGNPNCRIYPHSPVIGASMPKALNHLAGSLAERFRGHSGVKIQKACYPTH